MSKEYPIRVRFDFVLMRDRAHVAGIADVLMEAMLRSIVQSEELVSQGCTAYQPGAKIRLDAVGPHRKKKSKENG